MRSQPTAYWKWAAALGMALMVFAITRASWASPRALAFDAIPLLGPAAADEGGWRSLLVRLENPDAQPLTGSVEIQSRPGWARNGVELVTSAPFSLAPHARVSLELPTRAFGVGAPAVRVIARDAKGEPIAETAISSTRPADALLLELGSPSRLAPLLRNMPFASRRGMPFSGRPRIASIAVSAATQDADSGDPILPELPSGYGAATVVIGSGRDLARLNDAERAALGDWVLSGGALALALDRPEDLEQPLLQAMTGGRPTRGTASETLREPATFVVPPDEQEQANPSTAPTPLRAFRLAPGAELAKKLVGYSGGNLQATPWGAAASYGLGEVHLLAFDPREVTALTDPWTRHKLADLVRHAFDRQPAAVVRQGSLATGELNLDGIRRQLDPNQTSRWTIVVSALLLLIYATLAGPVSFYLAARKGQPLRALWQLPLWSGATLLAIVILGIVGKGLADRARKLSFVDAGAGMTRAAAVRFRGFYAASARDLTVRATRREQVLDLAGTASESARTLLVDRDGARLQGLRTKPWQTVLVREESFVDLSGGITLLPLADDYVIKNRTARDLIGVVLRTPSGNATYFRRIKDGASVRGSEGRPLGALGSPVAAGASAIALDAQRFAGQLDRDYPGLGQCWVALEPALGSDTEWWPADAPVLLGALDGGEGRLSDSGIHVDFDRLLVRVVGVGGSP